MVAISNKRSALVEIFKLMDNTNIGRIDTLELFAVILLSIDGKFEVLLMSNT